MTMFVTDVRNPENKALFVQLARLVMRIDNWYDAFIPFDVIQGSYLKANTRGYDGVYDSYTLSIDNYFANTLHANTGRVRVNVADWTTKGYNDVSIATGLTTWDYGYIN